MSWLNYNLISPGLRWKVLSWGWHNEPHSEAGLQGVQKTAHFIFLKFLNFGMVEFQNQGEFFKLENLTFLIIILVLSFHQLQGSKIKECFLRHPVCYVSIPEEDWKLKVMLILHFCEINLVKYQRRSQQATSRKEEYIAVKLTLNICFSNTIIEWVFYKIWLL